MFPAGAGMNRLLLLLGSKWRHVPRRRGDEPDITEADLEIIICSPQARG